MEGAVGGGGGDGLACSAAHASDLDILRDNPGAAASRAAPGRHDREAACAKPAQPAGSVDMAAKEFRKLAPALFEKLLRFGAHSNPSNARSAVVGKALQAVCICATVHRCTLRTRLFTVALSETLRAPPPQAPRCSQVVQNQRILVQTRPPRPGGIVNKTQPKAPLPQEGFGMNLFVSFSLSLEWFLGLLSLGIWFITVLRGRRKISFRVFGTLFSGGRVETQLPETQI